MRRYASSKSRVLLVIALLACGVFAAAGTSFGQAGGGGAAPAPAGAAAKDKEKEKDKRSGIAVVFGLVIGHVDFVTITIATLSIVGVTLMIQGIIKNRKSTFMPEETTEQIRQMIKERKFKELIEFTENDPSFISMALNPALKRAPSFSSMKEAMETALGEKTAEQFRKIEYLNIIGNLGPLLGLLGTVLGMIEAFDAMQQAGGSANPADLAGGISTALCHTFLGLFLAVPCLAAFGILRTVVDRLTVQGSLVAEELLLMIKPAEAKPAAAGVRPAGAAPAPVRKPAAPPAASPA